MGLLRLLDTEFREALERETEVSPSAPFTVATGKAAEPWLRALVELAGAPGTVVGVPNDFLGHTIDVAGLLTGGDILSHLRGRDLGSRVLIPLTMLRDGEGVFLDDLTPEDLARELGVSVIPVDCDGAKLLAAMRGQ